MVTSPCQPAGIISRGLHLVGSHFSEAGACRCHGSNLLPQVCSDGTITLTSVRMHATSALHAFRAIRDYLHNSASCQPNRHQVWSHTGLKLSGMLQLSKERKWATEACQDGARKAHAWLKRKMTPVSAVLVDGEPRADAAGLQAILAYWQNIWKVHKSSSRSSNVAAQSALPPFTAEQVLAVCSAYPVRKAPGPDDWSPATWKMLPLPFHARLAQILNAFEDAEGFPKEWTTSIALMSKPSGGTRPIALMVACARVRAKLRREIAEAWETRWQLPANWGVAEKACDHASWLHGLQVESARGQGLHVAG
eukprot:3137119-Amphidinium_carterae.1